jgi:hypothetical protein
MSTETTQNSSASTPPPAVDTTAPSSTVPKQIVNAQTVCNELNEKKKLCNGHLKQLHTGGQGSEKHLQGDDALFKCQTCGTVYMGPPLGHLRDPDKQSRFVERELTDLLLAAGGTMPIIVKNENGAFVLAEVATPHVAAPAAPSKAPPIGDTPVAESVVAKTATPATGAKAAATKEHAIKVGPIPGADGPVPGETREQKIERLRGVAAEAKRRAEAREAAETAGEVAPVVASPATEPAVAVAAPESETAETTQDAAPATATEAVTPPPVASAPIPGADGPVPGETFEQKIERLKGVVAAARERAIREGKRDA